MNKPESNSQESPSRLPECTPREAAVAVSRLIIERGFIAYFAGGCVRDEILGLVPTDFDIATSAPPEEIAKIFRSARGVGEAFGVMLVRWKGRVIEVATFRSDGEYRDGRRPSDVRFANANEDAQRRDFTINGLFRHPLTGEVVDYVDGQKDLANRILRAIGDPSARLREDRLRTLRAARFAARFEMTIDSATEQAICDAARDLSGVSRERIGGEFRRMFSHSTRLRSVQLIERWGLDAPALAESNSIGACARISGLPSEVSFATVLAAWRLDRAERAQNDSSGAWRESLNLSGNESKEIMEILEIVSTLDMKWDNLPKSARKRLASRKSFSSALQVIFGVAPQRVVEVGKTVARLATESGGISPEPYVSGADLIALGFQPGPRFKGLLDQMYDLQLEGDINSKEESIAFARREWNR